jgi:sugar phosphate isomerase/epimerase
MGQEFTVNRRTFLGGAAGVGGAAALGSWAPAAHAASSNASSNWDRGRKVFPPDQVGVEQFPIRDACMRLDQAVLGRLADDPRASNVPLPGGFRSVFQFVASLGYTGIEYFSYSQGANGPISYAQLRQLQDDAGLVALGTHTAPPAAMLDPATNAFSATGQAQVDLAHTLGMDMIGFAGNPTSLLTLGDVNANGTVTPGWQTMTDQMNRIGELLKAEGLRYYWHPEEPAFQFFNDPAHPELSRTHLISWWMANADPAGVAIELDTLHWYSGWIEYPDPVTGQRMADPLSIVLDDVSRFIAFHIKDGDRIRPIVTPPVPPYTQLFQRTVDGITFTDTIADGEGDIGKGYPSDPSPEVVGFRSFFDQVQAASNNRYKRVFKYISESDSAIGPATGTDADPGRSLRWARHSAHYLLNLSLVGLLKSQIDAPDLRVTPECGGSAGHGDLPVLQHEALAGDLEGQHGVLLD